MLGLGFRVRVKVRVRVRVKVRVRVRLRVIRFRIGFLQGRAWFALWVWARVRVQGSGAQG